MGTHECLNGILLGLSVLIASGVAQDEVRQADHDLLAEVSQRLLVAVEQPPADFSWPPKFEVITDRSVGYINAFATVHVDGQGKPTVDEKTGKLVPYVAVTHGLLSQVIEGEADRLAYVVGHELGHILLGHVVREPSGKTGLVRLVFSRQQELAADRMGAELALRAGYSYSQSLGAIRKFIDLGLEYSSFEGLGADHPAWSDRITLLDRDQALLWKAMSVFRNGTVFLLIEQHAAAERCFEAVIREFPASYEAWANLGYALLMRYCDALQPDDVRRLGVGQIVSGGFYERPESLEERLRGPNQDLWKRAVAALNRALELKGDLTLSKAHLGVAYLVRPGGKDVEQAERYLHEAADQARSEPTLHPLARAAVLINAGVADLASGQMQHSVRRLDEAQRSVQAFTGRGEPVTSNPSLSAALLYNRAMLLAASPQSEDRRSAVAHLEHYLRDSSAATAWRTLAYERYEQLCKELQIDAKSDAELRLKARLLPRPVASVELPGGVGVSLAETIEQVEERLGPGQEVSVVPGSNLVQLCYPKYGIELLAAEQVVAISLKGESAPAVTVQPFGLAAKGSELRLGQSKSQLDQLLANQEYDFRQIIDPEIDYRFYPALGLAVRVQGDQVVELVVAQIPRQERHFLGLR